MERPSKSSNTVHCYAWIIVFFESQFNQLKELVDNFNRRASAIVKGQILISIS